jgi:hypothetical protein
VFLFDLKVVVLQNIFNSLKEIWIFENQSKKYLKYFYELKLIVLIKFNKLTVVPLFWLQVPLYELRESLFQWKKTFITGFGIYAVV